MWPGCDEFWTDCYDDMYIMRHYKQEEKKMQVVTDKNGKEWEVEERCLVERKSQRPFYMMSYDGLVICKRVGALRKKWAVVDCGRNPAERVGDFGDFNLDAFFPVTPKWEEV